MPAIQRGSVRKLASGRYQLRYYDANGERQTGGAFETRSAAFMHYREVIEPQLLGREPELTLAELVERHLERHAAIRSPRTIRSLRERLRRPLAAYGNVPLRELQRMSGELADFRAKLPQRYAHAVMGALRQVLAAGIRYGYLERNPAADAGENPTPTPRTVRAFTLAELDAIGKELGATYGPLVPFAAATGLRPQEWTRLERADVDRERRLVHVHRTRKTAGSVRQVPLSPRALAALERLPARLDTRLLFPSPSGGLLDLGNFRRREWTPAVEAAGVAKPARIYDLRSTFASNALAAGVTPFELARIMGTSVRMIERHYGTLIAGAREGIAARLEAIEAELEKASTDEAHEGR
jgi:integrase